MEALELGVNMSFLNVTRLEQFAIRVFCLFLLVHICLKPKVGSGTGYFSTMVGLMIGQNGINHNIELHQELIDYGRQKLNEFVRTAENFDQFDFCVPRFTQGNILNLNFTSENVFVYDRIYVGFGINSEHEDFIKKLLKHNGIAVMPVNDNVFNASVSVSFFTDFVLIGCFCAEMV